MRHLVTALAVLGAFALAFPVLAQGGYLPLIMKSAGNERPTQPTVRPTRTLIHMPTETPAPDPRLIVFTSRRDGNDEIYAINADGTNERRLTDHPARDAAPCVSPDQSRIVFLSQRAWTDDLYVIDADGSNLVRLTYSGQAGWDPFWSADGSSVYYTRDGDLYSVGADGSG